MLEIHQIPRITDFTQVKTAEDNKNFVDQSNIVTNTQKETLRNNERVADPEQTDYREEKFDAKEEGKNKYFATQGKNGKKKEADKVVVKKPSGFDMRI